MLLISFCMHYAWNLGQRRNLSRVHVRQRSGVEGARRLSKFHMVR